MGLASICEYGYHAGHYISINKTLPYLAGFLIRLRAWFFDMLACGGLSSLLSAKRGLMLWVFGRCQNTTKDFHNLTLKLSETKLVVVFSDYHDSFIHKLVKL
jgi:hypothetical protein